MKVSVIIPCFNHGQYLEEALQSVLNQTYHDWECIIINDGSADDTEKIGQLWADKDSRFKYFTKTNGGLPNARNFGIERAKGIYILPLDADDYISSNYIELCVNALDHHNFNLVYGKVEQFGSRSGLWDLGTYGFNDLLISNMIHCTAMYSRSDWERVGGYDETMTSGLEDWEFWVHILDKNAKVKLLDSITFYYRIKDVSMISQMDKQKEMEVKAYVLKKHAATYHPIILGLHLENKKFRQNMNDLKFIFKRFLKLLIGIDLNT